MAFPLANALSLQGITLLTGALTGTAGVALFNTYRTMRSSPPCSATLFGQNSPGCGGGRSPVPPLHPVGRRPIRRPQPSALFCFALAFADLDTWPDRVRPQSHVAGLCRGQRRPAVDPRMMDAEEAEYAEAEPCHPISPIAPS
jgi:hypothetical protein